MKSTRLLKWYQRARRDLPWRRTSDPYAVWVSEIMLQQTRVAAVVPYYERFLTRFPDPGTLARAREETVLAHWAGLGYYRRARMLHAAAKQVARQGMPRDATGLRALPGIGAYTSHAIASICFGEPTAVVDGNVERVVMRLLARAMTKGEVQRAVDGWIPAATPGDFNQAVMELGATVCTPRSPRCDECPLRVGCAGSAAPERYPPPRARPKIRQEQRSVKLARSGDRVFLRRIGVDAHVGGMWDLPPSRGTGEPLGEISHGILDKKFRITIHPGRATGEGRWFTPRQLRSAPLATSASKCLRLLGLL